jgi:hypothetical protein
VTETQSWCCADAVPRLATTSPCERRFDELSSGRTARRSEGLAELVSATRRSRWCWHVQDPSLGFLAEPSETFHQPETEQEMTRRSRYLVAAMAIAVILMVVSSASAQEGSTYKVTITGEDGEKRQACFSFSDHTPGLLEIIAEAGEDELLAWAHTGLNTSKKNFLGTPSGPHRKGIGRSAGTSPATSEGRQNARMKTASASPHRIANSEIGGSPRTSTGG